MTVYAGLKVDKHYVKVNEPVTVSAIVYCHGSGSFSGKAYLVVTDVETEESWKIEDSERDFTVPCSQSWSFYETWSETWELTFDEIGHYRVSLYINDEQEDFTDIYVLPEELPQLSVDLSADKDTAVEFEDVTLKLTIKGTPYTNVNYVFYVNGERYYAFGTKLDENGEGSATCTIRVTEDSLGKSIDELVEEGIEAYAVVTNDYTGEEVTSDKVQINVKRAIDLFVGVDKTEVYAGESVTVKCNAKLNYNGYFDGKIQVVVDGEIVTEDRLTLMPVYAPEETYEWSVGISEEGTHTIKVCIDGKLVFTYTITRCSEDIIIKAETAQPYPSIVDAYMEYDGNKLYAGNSVEIREGTELKAVVTVKNEGFDGKVFIWIYDYETDEIVKSKEVYMEAGEEETYELTFVPEVGEHRYSIMVGLELGTYTDSVGG